MKSVQLPLSVEISIDMTITIHEVNWFVSLDDVSFSDCNYGEIGEMKISDDKTNKVNNYSIWFDDNGLHYVCLPTYEGDEELDVFLYEDLVS